MSADSGHVDEKQRAARLRVVVLLEYALAALTTMAGAWLAIATYRRPAMCVDTCFEPLYDVLVGLAAVFVLIIGAAVSLIVATARERLRAADGLPQLTDRRRIIVAGTALAAPALFVPLLVLAALLLPRLA